ncbi:MAG TPA: hypothetical protein VGA78_16320 [Gemmatimonadales bacterium]
MQTCLLLLVASAAVQSPVQAPAESLFVYEGAAPLEVRDSLIQTLENGVRIFNLTYASPKGGLVTAYLVVPPGPGPFAGVLFGHWGLGNRSEFLPEAIHYAERGAVGLMIDWPWTRWPPNRRDQGPLDKPEQDRAVFVQAVVDLRRGLDVLAARPDLDRRRLGYVGHSYGAQFGAVLAAVDPRVSAAVLMAGIPDNATFMIESKDPDVLAYRARWTREQIESYMAVNAPVDAVGWVGRISPRPLLMQFGWYEHAIPMESMRRYAAASREPRTVLWYPTGHELNDPRAWSDRTAWVIRQLHLSMPAR